MHTLPVRTFLLLLLLVTGCATRQEMIPDSKLVLGKTSRAEATTIMREANLPNELEQAASKGDVKMVRLSYSTSAGSDQNGVMLSLSHTLHFYQDVLVAYEFNSTFPDSKTDFNEKLLPQIRKGVSTRSDVEKILGKPPGRSVYPYHNHPNELAYTYRLSYLKADLSMYLKMLIITFDENDIVTDSSFAESGKR